jgi:hypothetical protein
MASSSSCQHYVTTSRLQPGACLYCWLFVQAALKAILFWPSTLRYKPASAAQPAAKTDNVTYSESQSPQKKGKQNNPACFSASVLHSVLQSQKR